MLLFNNVGITKSFYLSPLYWGGVEKNPAKLSTWLDSAWSQWINVILSKCDPTLWESIPLGNLVGGAFRAQAYIMEASSLQVPCALPQFLEREMTINTTLWYEWVDGKTVDHRDGYRVIQTPVCATAIFCSVWMERTPAGTSITNDRYTGNQCIYI